MTAIEIFALSVAIGFIAGFIMTLGYKAAIGIMVISGSVSVSSFIWLLLRNPEGGVSEVDWVFIPEMIYGTILGVILGYLASYGLHKILDREMW